MVNQLPMHLALVERERKVRAWQKESETLRALREQPSRPAGPRHWFAVARNQLVRAVWTRKPQPPLANGRHRRAELGSPASA